MVVVNHLSSSMSLIVTGSSEVISISAAHSGHSKTSPTISLSEMLIDILPQVGSGHCSLEI